MEKSKYSKPPGKRFLPARVWKLRNGRVVCSVNRGKPGKVESTPLKTLGMITKYVPAAPDAPVTAPPDAMPKPGQVAELVVGGRIIVLETGPFTELRYARRKK